MEKIGELGRQLWDKGVWDFGTRNICREREDRHLKSYLWYLVKTTKTLIFKLCMENNNNKKASGKTIRSVAVLSKGLVWKNNHTSEDTGTPLLCTLNQERHANWRKEKKYNYRKFIVGLFNHTCHILQFYRGQLRSIVKETRPTRIKKNKFGNELFIAIQHFYYFERFYSTQASYSNPWQLCTCLLKTTVFRVIFCGCVSRLRFFHRFRVRRESLGNLCVFSFW